jgi:PAS domain S-box-containing protein
MKTKTRLIAGFAVLVVLLWLIGFYAWDIFGNLNKKFSTVEEDIIPDAIAMTEVETLSNEVYRNVTEYLYHDNLYDMEEAKNTALLKLSRLEEIGLEYLPVMALPGMVEHGKDCILAGKIYDFYFSASWIIDLKERGADYSKLLARDRTMMLLSLLSMQERAGELKAASIAKLTTVKTAFQNAYSSGLNSIYLSAGLITLLAIAVAIFTTRAIVQPLHALRKGTEAIAKGNLSYKVGTKAKDEIGELSRAFDQMTQSLSTSMTSIDNLNQEIAERKRVEEALRESEERFSKAFHASPDMMAIVNLKDGKYVEVNDSFVLFTGYTREELVGHSNDEFDMWVDPQERDRMTRLLGERGRIRHEEYHFRTKSREIRTWLCSADIINIGGEPFMLAVATDISERKRIEEALRESEERFSKAFHASPGSISISRLSDGIFVEVNESFLRDKGYTREEVIGRSSLELEIWEDQEQHDRILRMLKEQGRVRNEPSQFRTKSGEIRKGYLSAELVSLGNEPCIIVLNTDVTQQQQAEEQVRLLSSVTQQVSDSTIVTDPNFKITYMNQAAEDLFGYSLEEIRGKGMEILNASPLAKNLHDEILKTVTCGEVWRGTTIKKRKDGSTFICDCRLSPLYDESGQICSYIDIQHDVTRQKEVDAKLQVQKQLIERIVATIPDGVLVIDNSDRIILANKAFYKIFLLNKRATRNRLFNEILPVDQLFNRYKAVKRGKRVHNPLEFRYQAEDIEKIITSNIIKMNGERILLTFKDISREREEEEKLYLTDRLASIGEMAAGLAHELNNPLTGILALSQLLSDSDIPEEYKEDLQHVYNEAKRAASIVKSVLLFARNNNYENGQSSANEVVKDVLRLREYEEKANNITVVTDLQKNPPDVPIDKFQLQQVFLNIILNAEAAIKDTNRPGTLIVKTETSNHHINVLFNDNGCGIKKNVLPRIFDPFFTTKDIGKGTGLGLSICYGIVVKHGGKISVKSKEKEGTTFTISLPIVK